MAGWRTLSPPTGVWLSRYLRQEPEAFQKASIWLFEAEKSYRIFLLSINVKGP